MIEINLLPPEILRQKKIKDFVLFVIMSIFPVILICVLFFFSAREMTKSVQRELTWAKGKVSGYQPALKELKELKDEKVELQHRLATIKDLVANRSFWPLILYGISRSLPDNIWLTKLAKSVQGEDQVITIEGFSLNQTIGIGKFVENLNKSSLFKEIAISVVSRSNIGKIEVMDFTINGKIKY